MALTGTLATETVRAESIAAGGRALARTSDGRACFIPRGAPGDLLEIEVSRDRGSWTEGRIVRVLEPGRDRRRAPCPYYDRCGGCALQHVEYEAQRSAKGGIVADALRRLGGWDAGAPDVVASPLEWRYRSRITFTLRRLPGGRIVAGLYARSARGRVLDVDGRCLLPYASIASAWDSLRSAWGGGARLLPAGKELRLTLRDAGAERVVLVVRGGSSGGDAEALLEAVPALTAIWHRLRGTDRAVRVAARAASPPAGGGEREDPDAFEGANAFSQVNREAAELLGRHVRDAVRAGPGLRVVDAYAGDGVYARSAAAEGADVAAIEREPEAVRRGRRLAPRVDFREGDVEALLARLLPADVVVLNPPRAGISARVAEVLLERPPARLVYASCDPATLGRDMARLGARFRATSARAFDLFPQTAHVETVVELCAIT